MTEEQKELLRQASDSIGAARLLLVGGYPGYAASRAYYAMFYIAEAFLEGQGLAFSKHAAVISAFGKHMVRSGVVPIDFHRFLMEAQDVRQSGDYGERDVVTHEEAQEQIRRAECFLDIGQNLIGRIEEAENGEAPS